MVKKVKSRQQQTYFRPVRLEDRYWRSMFVMIESLHRVICWLFFYTRLVSQEGFEFPMMQSRFKQTHARAAGLVVRYPQKKAKQLL